MANNHNIGRCFFTINGVPLQGFGVDAAVSISKRTELATLTVGCDGEATRNEMRDLSYEITLTLMSTSETNNLIEVSRKIAETIGGAGSTFTFTANSLDYGNNFQAIDCFVSTQPDMVFGKEVEEQEWVIVAPVGFITYGGSLPV
jgi:hypothetical protein